MILVTGATGSVGRPLLDELKSRGEAVRAMTRDAERAREFQGGGFAVAVADLSDLAALAEAMTGVNSVFLLSPQHPQQAELQGNAVQAASVAGVARIVKVSAGSAVTGENSSSWVGREHWQTEQQIKDSGIPYTFLRPNYYMKNLLMLAEPIRGGKLPVPVSDQPVAMIDTRDVAAAAAAVLAGDGEHDGRAYDLTGPEALTFGDVAKRISGVIDREVVHIDPPIDAAVESLRAKGAPDFMLDHFREIMGLFRDGAGAEVTDTVQQLTGHAPRRVDDFIRDHEQMFG